MKDRISQSLRNQLRPYAYKASRSLTDMRGRVLSSERKPDFLILGAQKAGTTTLYDLLVQHPNILSARTKEIAYFDRYYSLGPRWYSANFSANADNLTGEATPDYLYLDTARARIVQDLPEARFLVLLRNPVDRAISHYFHALRLGYETLPIEEAFAAEDQRISEQADCIAGSSLEKRSNLSAFSYRHRGLYAEQLEKWFKDVPRERFFIETSDRFFAYPNEVLEDALQFLGLAPPQKTSIVAKNIGTYRGRVPAALRMRLADYFEPQALKLKELIDIDITWDLDWAS